MAELLRLELILDINGKVLSGLTLNPDLCEANIAAINKHMKHMLDSLPEDIKRVRKAKEHDNLY